MDIKRSRLFLSGLLLSASTMTHAGNLSFLADTVVSEFTKTEASAFKQFIAENLVSLKDKEKALWESKESSLKGIVRPNVTFEQDGNTCRQTRFSLKGKTERKMFFNFNVCKVGDRWQIAQSPLSSFKEQDWNTLTETLNEALNDGENGYPVSWVIRSSGILGTIVPLNLNSESNQICREAAISISDSKGSLSSGRYEFCKQDNSWIRKIK